LLALLGGATIVVVSRLRVKDAISIHDDMRNGVNRQTHLYDILLHVAMLVNVMVHRIFINAASDLEVV
jgi:hypothetical protein